jgi:hypothetical protein
VNVQLTDAESGAHLWTDRLDTDPVGLASAQSEITGRLPRTINFKIVVAEGLRTEHERALQPNLRDLLIRGGPHSFGLFLRQLWKKLGGISSGRWRSMRILSPPKPHLPMS